MKLGILGGGQLGRMLALAGYPLGLCFRVLDPAPHSPACQVAEGFQGSYDDASLASRFASGLDVATYEFESLSVDAVRALAAHVPVYPPPEALETAQDRWLEKTFFQRLGVPTPPFASVANEADLQHAAAQIGFPCILKTRRFGYDGKGQFTLRTMEDVGTAWSSVGQVPCILEGFVSFSRELSILAVRDRQGNIGFYPLVENQHWQGMLRQSVAPAPNLSPNLQQEAETFAARALEALNYVGVLAIEFFEQNDRLLVNEMAPRVHNSGHWSIEGAETSQFENHLRAVLGVPLGRTDVRGHAAMLNLIGTVPSRETILGVPGVHLHMYGKQPFPMRKLGHLTLVDSDAGRLQARLTGLRTSPAFSNLWPGKP